MKIGETRTARILRARPEVRAASVRAAGLGERVGLLGRAVLMGLAVLAVPAWASGQGQMPEPRARVSAQAPAPKAPAPKPQPKPEIWCPEGLSPVGQRSNLPDDLLRMGLRLWNTLSPDDRGAVQLKLEDYLYPCGGVSGFELVRNEDASVLFGRNYVRVIATDNSALVDPAIDTSKIEPRQVELPRRPRLTPLAPKAFIEILQHDDVGTIEGWMEGILDTISQQVGWGPNEEMALFRNPGSGRYLIDGYVYGARWDGNGWEPIRVKVPRFDPDAAPPKEPTPPPTLEITTGEKAPAPRIAFEAARLNAENWMVQGERRPTELGQFRFGIDGRITVPGDHLAARQGYVHPWSLTLEDPSGGMTPSDVVALVRGGSQEKIDAREDAIRDLVIARLDTDPGYVVKFQVQDKVTNGVYGAMYDPTYPFWQEPILISESGDVIRGAPAPPSEVARATASLNTMLKNMNLTLDQIEAVYFGTGKLVVVSTKEGVSAPQDPESARVEREWPYIPMFWQLGMPGLRIHPGLPR